MAAFVLLGVPLLAGAAFAGQKRTVDKGATSGATYTTINAAVTASASGDTIYLQGAAAQSYSEAWPANITWALTLMSNQSLPDNFPVITISNWNYWDVNQAVLHTIQNVALSNCATIGVNNAGTFVFNQVVFKGFNSSVFSMGDRANYITFNNCVFKSNTGTIFAAPGSYNNGPYGTASNCTFYGNNTVSAMTPSASNRTLNIQNSVFASNSTTNSGGNTYVKAAWTYNLLPTSESGYGTGNVYNNTPGFTNGGGSYALISDLNIGSSSPAKDVGTNTGAPAVDIAGNTRPINATTDMGAYEYGTAGVSYTWTGSTSTDWGTGSNWSPSGIPGATDSITVDKSGGATIALNGNRSIKGVSLGNASANVVTIQPGSSGTLTIASGGSINTNASSTATHVISCPVAMSANMSATVANSGGTVDIQGVLSGAYALTKAGSGTLKLSGANTFSGATTINAGTLQLGSTSALGSTTGVSVTSGAALDLNGVNYSTSIPLTLNGTGISSGGALKNSSSTGATYAGLITLGSASSIVGGTGSINLSNVGTINGSGNALILGGAQGGTLASIIGTGAGTLVKQDAGTWTLSGANTYTGTTTIGAGTIKVGNTAAFGGTSSGTNVSSGGTLDLNGFAIGAEVVDIAGTGVGGNGAIINSGADEQAGLRYLTMSADASIGGSHRFDLRWLSGSFTEYFNANNHILTKVGTGHVTFQAITVQNFNGIVVAAGSFGAEIDATFPSGGAGFTLQSGTTLMLYQSTGSTAPISMNNATLWANNGAESWAGNISLTGSNTIQVDGTNLTLSGVISGSGSLVKTGANPLILSAANTYSGATTISSGTIQLGVANAISSSSAVTANGTLDMGGYSDAIGSLAGAGTVDNSTGSGTYTLTAGADNTSTTFSGVIKNTSGTLAVAKSGSGVLTLSGNNTFSGGYTHIAGDAKLAHSSALGSGSATTTSSGRIFLENGVNIGNALTISTCNSGVGHSVVNSDTGANATWSGTVNVNALCASGGHFGGAEDLSGSLTVSGPINMGGSATWVQQRDGLVIYSGGGNATRFDLLKGTARLGANNGLPSSARFSQTHAGYVSSLDLYGFSQTFQGIAAPTNTNTTLTNSQAGLSTLTLAGSVDTIYSGNITGSLALAKSGAFVQTLGGTNTYTGSTTIGAGTLKMGSTSALPSATTLSVTGTLDLNGYSETVGSITGAGTIDNTSANAGTYTLTTGGSNATTTFSGTIKNTAQTVALAKTGTGTLTLSGTNPFTGATTVSNGTLLVNGTNASSTVTVNSGAILGGTGSVGPIVGNSGTVRPGASGSKGILGGTTGNFSGGTSSKLSLRAAALTTAGTDFDRLNLSGALTLGGSSELDLDMTGIASAGTASGIVLASSISGTFGSVVPSNYTGALGFNVVYGGTSINLVVNNQAPSFAKGADQTVAEDAGAQTVAGWAASINKGSAYESSQTVSFTATNNNNPLFGVQPSISSAGILTYTPAANANGSATVTVRIHDNGGTTNSGVDSSAAQTFTITVSSVNDPSTFTSSGVATGTENVVYTYNITTSDVEGDVRTITAPTKPAWLTITDNGNGTATLSGTPLNANTGSNSVVLRVYDGTANTDQSFTITVADVNNAPAFTSSGVTTGTENVVYTYNITTIDADGNLRSITAPTKPAWLSITDNGNGTATLSGTPLNANTGVSNVTIRVNDGTVNTDQSFTITVADVNNAPTFTSSGVTTGTENVVYTYNITTIDADGNLRSITAPTKPAWLSITDNGNGTATLSGTPLNANTGANNVTIRVNDGTVTSEQSFTITVADVNNAPTFTSSGVTTGTENVVYTYNITTSDADGNLRSITAPTKPSWLSIADNGNGTATLSGTPLNANTGANNVTIRVNDGTVNTDQSFTITVADVNNAPTFTSSGVTTGTENVVYTYNITTIDADGNSRSITAPTKPAWLSIADNGNGTATLSGTPLNANTGVNNVTIRVNDGTVTTDQSFTITVADVNNAPTFTSSGVTTGTENVVYTYNITTTDADGNLRSITAPTKPSWLSIADNGNGTATLSGTPLNANTGANSVTIRVNDGTVNTDQSFTITVADVNNAPTFTSSGVTAAIKNAAYAYNITVSDGDGNALTVTAPTRPAWMSFLDHGDGTATLSGTPLNGDVGANSVVLRVSDGTVNVDQSFTVTVMNSNSAPAFTSSGVTTGTENVAYTYSITTSDIDGNTLAITAPTKPAWLTITDHGDGTATLSGTPLNANIGANNVVLRVGDGLVDVDQSFTITVADVNNAPTFTSSGVTTGTENAVYTYNIATIDADGNLRSITAPTKPAWLSISDHGDGTATLSGTPLNADIGNNNVTIRVNDGTVNTDQSFAITVADVNNTPTFTSSGVTTGTENVGYTYSIATSDADGDLRSITAPTKPAWLSISDHGDGTATLSGTPLNANTGVNSVTIRVNDGAVTTDQSFTITVADVNNAPTFTSSGVTTGTENVVYTYNIATSDADGNFRTITVPTKPAWLSFTDHGNGTATLNGTPLNANTGANSVTVRVNDGTVNTDQSFTITVADVNNPTVFTSTGITTGTENVVYSYNITTMDADGVFSTITAPTMPSWLNITDNGDGTATLSGTPLNANTGANSVVLRAYDGTVNTDQSFTITVADVNNAPVFTSSGVTTGTENLVYTYNITTTDADGNLRTITAQTKPSWLSFTDNGNGTASLAGTPLNAHVGANSVVLRVDDGTVTTDQSFTITVVDVNNPSVFTSSGGTTGTENAVYTYNITTTDADGNSRSITAPTKPAWLSITDHGNGTATLTGTPLQAHAGANNVTIRVNDATVNTDQSFTITVADVNNAATFTSSGVTTGTENALYTYSITTSDGDGDARMITAPIKPSWLTITDNGDGTATLSGTPLDANTGVNNVTVRVYDGIVNTDQSFTITVADVNNAPTFTSSGVTTGTENALYTYSIATIDADGDALAITVPTKPSWLTITDHGNGTATLGGTPLDANTGVNNVTIRVNDGTVIADQSFMITVADVNNAPTFTSSGVATGAEDALYSYNITTIDADDDVRTITAQTKPSWLTIMDNGNGTATLSGTPSSTDVGSNGVVLRVSDGALNTDQSFTITVANVNHAPVFTSSGVTAGTENVVYAYNITTTDADGNPRTITSPTKPAWLSITDNGNGTATLSGTPLNANTGVNNVTIRVNDGTLNTDQSFTITVADVNNASAFISAGVTTGTENVLYTYNITTIDADGDVRTIMAPTKPSWLTITDNGNGTATLSGTPLNANTGVNNVTIRVNDGTVNTDQSFTITVADVNNAATFSSAGVTTGTENMVYTYNITTSDADGDIRSITAPTKPAWLTITDNGNGTATLSGTPLNANTGVNNVTIRVNDGTVNTDQTFTITVADVNNAPAFTSTGITSGTENVVYTYNITTSDADGNSRSITAPTKPSWLTITDNGNGTATLSGTPLNANTGVDSVTIRVNDGTVNTDQSFTITVADVNNAAMFTSSGVTTGTENVAYTYNITTSDADGDVRTITSPTKPSWMTITDNGNGTATLSGTPLNANAGVHNVTIRVNDGSVNTDQSFTITVADVNNAPTFTSSGVTTGTENAVYTYNITTSDADGNSRAITAPTKPAWLTVTDNGNGTATLSGTPLNANTGANNVTIRVNDGTVNTDQSFTITVVDVNNAPTFTSSGVTTGTEGAVYTYGITTTDADGDSCTITVPTKPAWLSIKDNGNGTATLSGTPLNAHVGANEVVLRVNDGTVFVDQSFAIAVGAVNHAPSYTKGADQTVLENAVARALPGWAANLSAGPSNESIQSMGFRVSNSNSSLFAVQPSVSANGVLAFAPAADSNGVATVYVRLGDNGGTANGGVDSSAIDSFTITVLPVNHAPSFAKGANQSLMEDPSAQTIPNWAGSISNGPANEGSQSIGFNVWSNRPSLFSSRPALSQSGTLAYAVARDSAGVATVFVRLGDNGGAANGGGDSSAVDSFTIDVQPVNDAPRFTKGQNQSVLQSTGSRSVIGWATGIASGPGNEASQHVRFRLEAVPNSLFAIQPAVNAIGDLSYVPAPGAWGLAKVALRVLDDGGTANGGVDSSLQDTFTIEIRRNLYPKILPDTLRLRPRDSAAFSLALRTAEGRDSIIMPESANWTWQTNLGKLESGRVSNLTKGRSWIRVDRLGIIDSALLIVESFDSALATGKDSVTARVAKGAWITVPPRASGSRISVIAVDTSTGTGIAPASITLRVKVVPLDTAPMILALSPSAVDDKLKSALGLPSVFAQDSSGKVRVVASSYKDSILQFAGVSGISYWLGYDTVPVHIRSDIDRDSLARDTTAFLSFSLGDNTADARAYFCVLKAGAIAPSCTLLVKTDTVSGRYAIAKSSIPLGARVWMEGRDTRSVTSTAARDIVTRVDTLRSTVARSEDRYELLALPYTNGKGAILDAYKRQFGALDPTRWRVFRSDTTSFREVTESDTVSDLGKSFWVRTRKTSLSPWVSDVWTTSVSKSVRVDLVRGWNMVGNPYAFDVDWSRVVDSSGIDNADLRGPYSYDPTTKLWSTPDTTKLLRAWQGVAVYNSASRSLNLRIPAIASTGAPAARAMAASNSFRMGVRGWQGAGDTSGVWVGVDSTSKVGLDGFDNPIPPAPSRGLNLGLLAPVGARVAQSFFTDVRPMSDSGAQWTLRFTGIQANRPLSLGFDKGRSDSTIPVWVFDAKSGRWLEATGNMDFAVGQEAAREFKILVGASPRNRPDISRFGLASRAHGVGWYIPDGMGRTRVKVDIYDLRGRRLMAVVDEDMDPGIYSRDIAQVFSVSRLVVVLSAGGQRKTLGTVIAR